MFAVVFTRQAKEDLRRLDRPIAQRVLNKIRWLAENISSITPQPLTGPWQGVYKLRVGHYRVLYTLQTQKQQITILLIRHRSEVYKT